MRIVIELVCLMMKGLMRITTEDFVKWMILIVVRDTLTIQSASHETSQASFT